jgi:S-formylglutathione hydrolase FrmB
MNLNFVNVPETAPLGVSHKTFFSSLINQEVGYNIYLPPDYGNADVDVDVKYPVMYWLHGMGGNESSDIWVAEHIQKYYAGNSEAAQIAPIVPIAQMIVVFVNGTGMSGYWDAPDGSLPVESIIIEELIPHIDSTYRTVANRTGRVIEGFSMGGQGALYYAVKYPELFCSVINYAGPYCPVTKEDGSYYDCDDWENISGFFLDEFGALYRQDPALVEPYTAHYWITKNAVTIRRDVKIRIVCGALDILSDCAEKLHTHLDKLEIPHEYEIMPEVDHNIGKMYELGGERGLHFHNKCLLLP